MHLTCPYQKVSSDSFSRRALARTTSILVGMLLLGCSAESGEALSDTGQSQTSASALHTSSPTSLSPQATQVLSAPSVRGPKGGTADVTITFNHAPVVTNVLSDHGRLDTDDHAQLRAIAADPDGDSLAFAWDTRCQGSFDNPASPTTDFNLGALPTSGFCDLVVTVSDGHGGVNHGTLTLTAGPPPTVVVADPS